MQAPKLSVILPANRYDEYLIAAIKSVIDQDFKDFELLVVLGGQSGDFLEVLQKNFTDSRILYLKTQIPNLVFALNLAIDSARSSYIVRMDSDDVCKVNRLQVLWDTICANPTVDVIGSGFELIDFKGDLIRFGGQKKMSSAVIKAVLPFRCCIPHPTVIFKKNSVLDAGSYCWGKFSEDYDLWLRMSRLENVEFLIIDDVLLEYRLHTTQATYAGNGLNIFAHDIAIKLRELIITRKPIFVVGMLFSLIDFIYKKYISKFRRR